MSEKYVYVMPGVQGNRIKPPPFLMIAVLDCSNRTLFKGDPSSKEHGYGLGQNSWSYLEVTNPDFIK